MADNNDVNIPNANTNKNSDLHPPLIKQPLSGIYADDPSRADRFGITVFILIGLFLASVAWACYWSDAANNIYGPFLAADHIELGRGSYRNVPITNSDRECRIMGPGHVRAIAHESGHVLGEYSRWSDGTWTNHHCVSGTKFVISLSAWNWIYEDNKNFMAAQRRERRRQAAEQRLMQ